MCSRGSWPGGPARLRRPREWPRRCRRERPGGGGARGGLAPAARAGSILERTAHGAAWVIGWRMATRLLGVVNALVLVRLLVPADFGVVALGYSFVSSLDQFCTVDIKDAIIRDDRGDRELFDTGFTLNLLRALLMGAALAIGAGPIAHFFGDPRLKGIVLVFAAMT
ncbi:MAG TPA: oligosaccharide flippase family protein, partial [Acetobacteraceae bacterium]|nr:oligosaccharide flippase family protein [Acetobacteraceae bacterium]